MTNDNRYLHLVRRDCPLPPGAHVVVYCRDSGGDEQDRSVAQQVDVAREYCAHHNLVIDHIYRDEARLSSNTTNRDELKQMLSDIRRQRREIHDRKKREKIAAEQPFGVILWKSNRLGRDSIEATYITTDLRMRGVTLINLLTAANTGNAAIDALIEAFQQWKDEQELEEISGNSKRGLAQLVGLRDTDTEFLSHNPGWESTGRYIGLMPGSIPRGFKGERVQIGVYRRKKGRQSGEKRVVQRMVPDPEMWDRCYMAWEMRHNGASYDAIHKETRLYKNINGYDTFFANPIYYGTLRYGEKLYEDFVPAMIPKAWYDEEQRNRAERQKKREGKPIHPKFEPRRVGGKFLLSGLVYCGHIDGEEHPMNVESIPAKKGKRGNYSCYVCQTMKNSRGGACEAKRVSLRNLDQTVIENLLAHVLTVKNLLPIAKTIEQELLKRSDDADVRIDTLEERLREVRKSLDNILDAIENMGYAKHLQQRYDERKREEEEVLNDLARIQALKVNKRQIKQMSGQSLADWIAYMRAALEGEDRALARRVIEQFVAKIVIKQGTGTLYYTFPFPDDSYMSSQRNLDLMRV